MWPYYTKQPIKQLINTSSKMFLLNTMKITSRERQKSYINVAKYQTTMLALKTQTTAQTTNISRKKVDNQLFTFKGQSYKVSELSQDQIALLRSILAAEEKIANLQSELTVLQAGKEAIVETFSKVAKTLTPVSAQAEA